MAIPYGIIYCLSAVNHGLVTVLETLKLFLRVINEIGRVISFLPTKHAGSSLCS